MLIALLQLRTDMYTIFTNSTFLTHWLTWTKWSWPATPPHTNRKTDLSLGANSPTLLWFHPSFNCFVKEIITSQSVNGVHIIEILFYLEPCNIWNYYEPISHWTHYDYQFHARVKVWKHVTICNIVKVTSFKLNEIRYTSQNKMNCS